MTPEQTVAGREASGCIEQGDNVSALHARGEGAESRLVALISPPHYQAILALPGSGIHEPAQLAGRRLGLPARDEQAVVDVRRASASRGFHSATALSCLFCDEYEEVELPPAGEQAAAYAAERAALADGTVDAIYVAGPEGRAVARELGAVEVVDLGRHLDPMVRVNATTPLTVTVSERLLRSRPRTVARQLAELPDARLDARALDALRAQKDWLLTHGYLDVDVDVTAWADAGPLDAARG